MPKDWPSRLISSNFSTRSTTPPRSASCATTPLRCSAGVRHCMPDDDVDLDLLREAARDFLTGRVAQDSLKELAAMDWTGLLVEEDLGGSGWRPVETVVIGEELGRARN